MTSQRVLLVVILIVGLVAGLIAPRFGFEDALGSAVRVVGAASVFFFGVHLAKGWLRKRQKEGNGISR